MSDPSALVPGKIDALSKPQGFQFVSITELSAEQKQVLKDTVAQGTTDTELIYFLNVALSQDLDPFRKEVWCIKYGGKLTIQTGRDGVLKVAKRDPTFDRIQSAEVREGDDFRIDLISGQVEHRATTKRGDVILGAYAIITRKDGVKLTKYVTFSEYVDHSSSTWKDYPTAMICKAAESVLCKQFANVTGIVAEETMRKDGSVIDSSPTATENRNTIAADLVAKIEACATQEEFTALRDTIAGAAGKLFGPEKEQVYAAAKKKKAELEAVPVEPTPVPDTEPVAPEIAPESHADRTAMPQDEYQELLESLKAHDTLDGLKDLWTDVIVPKPKTAQQHADLEDAYQRAVDALDTKPAPKPKKKAA